MTCTHCGHRSVPGVLTLRISTSDREPVDVDLQLCGGCLKELLTEPEVDLIKPLLVYLTGVSDPVTHT